MNGVSRKDFFEKMTSLLDPRDFHFDKTNLKISVYLPILPEHIKDLKKTILGGLGAPQKLAERKWEDDLTHSHFKIDSHLVDYDGLTLKVNKSGQLYVDPLEVVNSEYIQEMVTEQVLGDEKFMEELADRLVPRILSKLLVEIPPVQKEKRKCHKIHDPNHEYDDYEGLYQGESD